MQGRDVIGPNFRDSLPLRVTAPKREILGFVLSLSGRNLAPVDTIEHLADIPIGLA